MKKQVGRALKDFTRRDEVVLATKVYFPMKKSPNGGGLSRKAIINEIDNSLKDLERIMWICIKFIALIPRRQLKKRWRRFMMW